MGWRWPAWSRSPPGTAERRASETDAQGQSQQARPTHTVGEDKAYDTSDHVTNLRAINVTPMCTERQLHRNRQVSPQRPSTDQPRGTKATASRNRAGDDRIIFGWGKQHGTMRKTKHRGIARVAADFLLT